MKKEECKMKELFNPSSCRFLHSSFFILTSCLLASCATAAAPQKFSGATPLEWSVRLADSEMARLGDKLAWKEGGKAKWDYTASLFTLSLLKLNEQVPDRRYVDFVTNAIGSFILPNGEIQTYKMDEYQLDAVNPGKTMLLLCETPLTIESRYGIACNYLREQLYRQPRTPDGGFWHKQRYTNQMWLDGIYMAAPFYTAIARDYSVSSSIYDDVAKQLRLIDEHTYDAKTGLNYHGWDAAKIQPWANPATGCSSNFWGRAMGWYAMALVDTLDYFPTNHPARPQIIATLQKLSAGVVKWQDAKTGLWWQVMDQGDRKGNYREATASAMFVYALAKGVNHGYLPREYATAAVKGYGGIVNNLIKNDGGGKWSLTQCCSVAGLGGSPSNGKIRDGSFDYYVGEPVVSNDLKGVGPFILAGIELQHLIGGQ
jgi:unsaturated rhamnogalacturonyl hydrolase